MATEDPAPYAAQDAVKAAVCRVHREHLAGILDLPDSELRPALEAVLTGDTSKCPPGVAWAVNLIRRQYPPSAWALNKAKKLCPPAEKDCAFTPAGEYIPVRRRRRLPAK